MAYGTQSAENQIWMEGPVGTKSNVRLTSSKRALQINKLFQKHWRLFANLKLCYHVVVSIFGQLLTCFTVGDSLSSPLCHWHTCRLLFVKGLVFMLGGHLPHCRVTQEDMPHTYVS